MRRSIRGRPVEEAGDVATLALGDLAALGGDPLGPTHDLSQVGGQQILSRLDDPHTQQQPPGPGVEELHRERHVPIPGP